MAVASDFPPQLAGALPPGPSLPRALQAMLWTWRFPEFTARWHARFGDTFTVRVGSLATGVLTKDRDAIRRLFTGDPLHKRHGNDLIRTLVGTESLIVLKPAQHLARRKLLLPPFHGEHVQAYARLMRRLVDAELERWRQGQIVSVQSVAQTLTLDVILQAVLGISDIATRQRLREVFDAMATPATRFGVYVPQLARRARWNLLSRPYWQLKDELDALLFRHIVATREDPRLGEREDVLARMVLARDEDGCGLGDEQLRDELVTLIAAGHETTATAIAWGVELLAHSPAVMAQAREGDEAYLDALVKEILRIRSPVPLAAARHALEPFAIGEWTIPPEVTILVNGYGLHRDARIYPEPEAFRPERFLDRAPDAYTFLPFGGGAHRCLGAALATLEIKVVLGAILARFELEPLSSEPARPTRRAPVTLAPRGGARVRILG